MVRLGIKNIAFSMAEALVSMAIIVIVALGAAPILTKQKSGSGLNTVTVKGTYACYWDEDESGNIKLFEQKCEEKDCSSPKEAGDECTFRASKYADRLYTIMAGAGSKDNPGQVFTEIIYTVPSSYTVSFKPGKYDSGLAEDSKTEKKCLAFNKGTTSRADTDFAYAGYYVTNGVQYKNIEKPQSCVIYQSSKEPEKYCPDYYGTDKCLDTENAEINDCASNGGAHEEINVCMIEPFIIINGCECLLDANKPNNIVIKDINVANDNKNYDRLSLDQLDNNISGERIKYSHFYKYPNDVKIYFNFKYQDSSYDIRKGLTGEDDSHMADIVGNINPLRQNELTKKIVKLKPGAKGQNGAVVIMW